MSLLALCTLIIFTTPHLAMGEDEVINHLSGEVVNRGEVVYNADCKPPDGFTGGTYSSNSLLPIEKCCPQTDPCSDIQGYCSLKWAIQLYPRMCDHMTYDCRDYQCVCCVKCSEDKCSKCTETRGECKKECRPDEVEDTANPCSFAKCKCCKKCDIQPECQDAGGTCVGSYEQCPIGSHPSNSGCCGGCFCCKPVCAPLPACSQVEGAYCSETGNCAGGFYACHGLCQKTSWHGGYEGIEKCYCCIPKWTGDYITLCPADDTTIATPEYKAPDKGDKPTTEGQPVDTTKAGTLVPIKPIKDQTKKFDSVQDEQTKKVMAIDATKAGTLVPIKPLRDKTDKVDSVQEEPTKKVMAKESASKSLTFSDVGIVMKTENRTKNISSVSNNKNNDKYNNDAENSGTIPKQGENSNIYKHMKEDQVVETETHSTSSSKPPNSKQIFEAINLLKKLLNKNKSRKKRHTPKNSIRK